MTEAKEEDEQTSPNERIGWDTREDPLDVMKLSPVMPSRRGKKRARSSSPVSSPASHSKPRKPAVNVEKLSRALKSPHADPALELWDRFSLSGATSTTPLGAINSTLAQIMVASSPRPSKTIGGSGLRRATSCGANWPKRRRVERIELTKPMEVAIEESPSRHCKTSMVNALLQSVTGEINRSKAIQSRQDALKSPSPKKRSHPAMQSTGSPSRRTPRSKPTPPMFDEKAVPQAQNTNSITLKDDASDYGDDDFDDDTLMELDATMCQPSEKSAPNLPIPPKDSKQNSSQQQHSPVSESFEYEFDDDVFDDVFTTGEVILTQLDSTHYSKDKPEISHQPAVSVAAQSIPVAVADDLTEDLYDDDFGGDFDFEAAEMAATQSVSKQTKGFLPVRR